MTKKKIAVLGGGLGSMSALAWITSQEGAAERYDITVYQMGWRLGGKGASGRGFGERVEEHGLHIWFGFYENAFRTMRMALEAIGETTPAPVATYANVADAFTPQSLVTFEEQWKGGWQGWPILFPPNGGEPGVGEPIVDFWDVLETMLGWLVVAHDEWESKGQTLGAPAVALSEPHSKLLSGVAGATHLHSALGLVKKARSSGLHLIVDGIADLLALLLRAYLEALWLVCSSFLDDTAIRRFFILNDLGASMLIGTLEERLFEDGFEKADDMDWIDWLAKVGARPVTTQSGPVRTVYDLVFGFAEGDTDRPAFAAGTAIRGIMRMVFTYKGALMFKMNAGMGDTIFTPFYGLLKSRGVKFEFFHKVDSLELEEGQDSIARVNITRQVNLVDPSKEYWPLRRVKALDCWPSEPDWKQIAEADKLANDPFDPGHPYDLESWWTSWKGVGTKTLERGEDFDVVLLGIPVGAIPYVAPQLVDRYPAWKQLVHGEGASAAVATTPTLGVQLWLSKTAEELGWVIPEWALQVEREWGSPLGLSTLLGGYEQSLDTIADMSHLLPVEQWPAGSDPKSVQYVTGPWKEASGDHPFTDHAYPKAARDRLFAAGLAWFAKHSAYVWPKGASAALPNGLDPKLLIAPGATTDDARWAFQWWRVNIDPNERYVLSVPRSTQSRLWCGDTKVDNLLIAGDWTWNPVLNAGCVEASVASGMECSRVLTGQPEIAGADAKRGSS